MVVKGDFVTVFEGVINDFIQRRRLLAPGVPVIVALSGGADSVALLSVLTRLGFTCVAAHCNFHLRGAESDRDQRFCMELTASLGVDLLVRHFDVPAYQNLSGDSTEMACRNLRYSWFREIADTEGAQAIAVGHHREDRVETFFLNLMRGAGITGLTSMNARAGDVVRPLLEISRADIERYLAALGLDFITDSSNSANDYRRNRVRNIILPQLETQFPGAVEAVLRSISYLESTRAIYREAVELKKEKYMDGAIIDIAGIASEPEAETILFEFLRPLNFSFDQTQKILAAAAGSGQRFESTDGRLVAELSRGLLSISDSRSTLPCERVFSVNLLRDITSPVHIAVSRHDITEFSPVNNPAQAYFDLRYAQNPENKWELRHYRKGDRMVPFGSKASKLVSDIFSDAKLTAAQKRRAWILTCNGEIAWIIGLRNAAVGCVNPRSTAFVKLNIISDNEEYYT